MFDHDLADPLAVLLGVFAVWIEELLEEGEQAWYFGDVKLWDTVLE